MECQKNNMSRFSHLPKDILIELLHIIDDDNRKKIKKLKLYKAVIEGIGTARNSDPNSIFRDNCEKCDYISISHYCSCGKSDHRPWGLYHCSKCNGLNCEECMKECEKCKDQICADCIYECFTCGQSKSMCEKCSCNYCDYCAV